MIKGLSKKNFILILNNQKFVTLRVNKIKLKMILLDLILTQIMQLRLNSYHFFHFNICELFDDNNISHSLSLSLSFSIYLSFAKIKKNKIMKIL